MPRLDRSETVCEGSYHHIIQRGVNRATIFKDATDYQYFKKMLSRYLKKYPVCIYNYCLMPNHIHMLVSADHQTSLSRFMQCVFLAYSAYYRLRYKYTGYLWQGRFKNFPIKDDSYLLECARYIERNPIRTKHKLVQSLNQFQWSSYKFYAFRTKDELITENPLYNSLASGDQERMAKYREYVEMERPYEKVLDDVFKIS